MKQQKAYSTWGLSPWSTDGKPPSQFRLFKYGENRSTKGTVFLTRESARKCLSSWIDYGNDLSGDYNHAITNPNIEAPRASMWFSLALMEDGLYAVNVKYTAAASAAIESKEYRYYSPYFAIEADKHNRPCVVEIINVALTNVPATKNQRPLVGLSKNLAQWSNQMFDQKQIDGLKALLIEGGIKEELASDLILKMQGLLAAPSEMEEAPLEEMPLAADPEKKEDEMPMGAEVYTQALSILKDRIKAQDAKIAKLEQEHNARTKNAKEELFAQFKREGRLAFTTDAAARKLLDANADLFRETFSAVAPLSQTSAPPAPVLKTIGDSKPKNASTDNLVGPVLDVEAVNKFMSDNKVSYREAYNRLANAAKKGN